MAEYRDSLRELGSALQKVLSNTQHRLNERADPGDKELSDLVGGVMAEIPPIGRYLDATEDKACAPMDDLIVRLKLLNFVNEASEGITRETAPAPEEAKRGFFRRLLGGIGHLVDSIAKLVDKLAELGQGTPLGGPLKNFSKLLSMLASAIQSKK